jgi:beta-lactam-binding protein with PASTA domain
VPALTAGTPLLDVQNALTAASCTLGKKSYSKSHRYARGTLIKLIPAAATKLDNNAAVRVVVSSGAPCKVPNVRPGMKLADAKARLTSASCGVGKVTRRRSRSRRGRVIAFTPASGTSLAAGSPVGIVVSKGRRHGRR